MEGYRLTPNVVTYTALIRVCEKNNAWEKALDLFHQMTSTSNKKHSPILPNSYTMVAVIGALGKGGKYDEIVELVKNIHEKYSNSTSSTSTSSTLSNSAQYGGGGGSGGKMSENNDLNNSWFKFKYSVNGEGNVLLKPSVFTFGTALDMCAKGNQVDKVMELFELMPLHNVKPNLICYNTVISALASNGQWGKALEYFEKMKVIHEITPDVISYTTLINACEKGGELEKALALLKEMESIGLQPNAITFASVLRACENRRITTQSSSSHPRHHQEEEEEDEKNASFIKTGKGSPASKEREEDDDDDDEVYVDDDVTMATVKMALDRGIYNHVWVKPSTIDLHACTAPVARSIIKYFLINFKQSRKFPPVSVATSTSNDQSSSLDHDHHLPSAGRRPGKMKHTTTTIAQRDMTLAKNSDVEDKGGVTASDAHSSSSSSSLSELSQSFSSVPTGTTINYFMIITGKGKNSTGGEANAVLPKAIRHLFKEENIPIEDIPKNQGAFLVYVKDILK
jgi:pentatricopeptide repeat protein